MNIHHVIIILVFIILIFIILGTLKSTYSKPVFKIEKNTSQSGSLYYVYQLYKIYNIIPFWERQSSEYTLQDAQEKVKQLQSYKTELIEIIGNIKEQT